MKNLERRLKSLEASLPQPTPAERFDENGFRLVGGPRCYLHAPPATDEWQLEARAQQAALIAGDVP